MTAPAPILPSGPPTVTSTTGVPPADGTGRFEPHPLRLVRVPLDSWEAAVVVIQRNFEAIESYLRTLGGGSRGMATMAQAMGWAHFKGAVSDAADTKFTHNLGRIPEKIVHVVDTDGQGRMVLGSPGGTGPNTTPWTANEIWVRASVTGNFEFMVI